MKTSKQNKATMKVLNQARATLASQTATADEKYWAAIAEDECLKNLK